ncbi:MAG: 3-phosphoshikimate 1-carboxyvinyltransferase [Cryomorphaceae bacterium]
MTATDLITVRNAGITGRITVNLPASKSISNRLLVMRALSGGALEVENLSTADDTRLLDAALRTNGNELWMGHAGTALRFGLAWAAVTPGVRTLKGSERLSQRPVGPLIDALRTLGADITCTEREGYAPLRIAGRNLKGGSLTLDASVSSQFITALMLIAPTLEGGLELNLSGKPVSTPYLRMTARLMRSAGVEVERTDTRIFIPESTYAEATVEVEPDWSAASYFYTAVALSRDLEVELLGLSAKSLQGDAAVADIFERFGVDTRFTARGALLSASEIFDDSDSFDFLSCPDLAQTVAVAAAGLQIPFSLTGLQTLRIKETDRIAALAAELAKCGTGCKAEPDTLHIRHFSDVSDMPSIATYHDHRMAMAFAPLALALGEISIEDPEVVTKSFPEFWAEMGKVLQVVR